MNRTGQHGWSPTMPLEEVHQASQEFNSAVSLRLPSRDCLCVCLTQNKKKKTQEGKNIYYYFPT